MSSMIIPALRYRDANTALEWLCTAFGFSRHLVVQGNDESVVHAQLVYGDAMIMLGSEHGGVFDDYQKPPSELGGVGSQSAYVIVEDADAHFARAVAAGAEVILDLEDQDYGGRGYTCRDPEGQVWSFGTYNPWEAE